MKIIKPKNVEITATISDVSTVKNVTFAFQINKSLSMTMKLFRLNQFQNENCLVTNISMTECIRPALYQAYNHVTNIKLNDSIA